MSKAILLYFRCFDDFYKCTVLVHDKVFSSRYKRDRLKVQCLTPIGRENEIVYFSLSKTKDLVPSRVLSSTSIMWNTCKAVVLEVGEASEYYNNQNGRRCLSNSQ